VAQVLQRGAHPEDVLPTLNRVVRSGALERARAEGQRHAAVAESALNELGDRIEVELLRAAVRTAVDRER
jgi:hypothetical protein